MTRFVRIKFPSNLVRKAEELFESEPFLNLNSYWIGVNMVIVETQYEPDVREMLESAGFQIDSVSFSDFK